MKDKKQSKEKLKSQSSDESTDEKELLFQITNDLMLYLNLRGRITKINRAGIAFSGFSEDETIGQLFWKIPGVFSKRNIPKYLKVFKNTIRGEPTESFLSELHEKSGKKHIMEFSTFPIKKNRKITSILVVGKDITEQKKSESKLHETGEKYRLITENTSDLISLTTFTLNPTYTYASPSHEKIVGYVPEDLIGKPCFDLVHPDDKKKLLSMLRKYVDEGGKKFLTEKDLDVSEAIQYRFKDKSGNWHYLESTVDIAGNELLIISKDFTERRRVEGKIKAQSKFLEGLIQQSPVPTFVLDSNGICVMLNDAFLELFKVPDKTLILRNNALDNLTNKKHGVDKYIKEALKGKIVKPPVIKYQSPFGGKPIFLTSKVFPIFSPNGEVTNVVVMHEDFTERKQSEEKLRESEEKYRDLFENANDLIQAVKPDGSFLYVNSAWKRTLGYSQDEISTLNLLDIIHPDSRKHCMNIFKRLMSGETIENFEAIFVARDGGKVIVEGSANCRFKDGKPISTRGIFRDITEGRRAEENYKILFNSSPDALMVIAKDGEILSVNPSMAKGLGISIKELVGKSIHKILPKEVGEKRTIIGRKALETGEIQENEDERDGKYFHNIFVPIFTSDGENGIQVIARDITESKNAEKKISKLNECFLSLGSDARKNIKIIVNAAGEILGGACLLYNRLEKERGLLCTWGIWNEPEGYKPEDDPEGHICYDVIRGNKAGVVIIEDLSGTKYETIDPNVKKYKLKSYLGYPIRLKGEAVGSFCLCGVKKRVFTQDEIKIMGMLAQAVANEEERKLAQDELQKAHDELEERVTERTEELSRTNEVLQIEITEHNKAEEEIKRTKDYLDNVIDSASEFMLVVDMNYKVSTWNKTAERLTGYKKREVLRRSINSLDVFLNSKDLQDDIKNIQNGVKIPFNELILRSKTGAKKLVRAYGSIVMGSSTNQTGVLFVGKEITQDSEMRGKLLQGNSYLIADKSNTSALNLLVDLSVSGSDGLFITRGNPNVIQSMFQAVDAKVIMFSRDRYEGFENVSSLGELTAKIKEFVAKKPKPVVLIDRVDYLLTNFSFEAFVKSLYEINNIISTHNAILLMRVNSDILNASQLAFIEEELKPLPSQRIDAVELDDQVYGVLTFIDKQNKNNVLVSFKKISQEFSISKVTTAKRLNMLDDRGLIFIKKQGKSKTVHISDKGKILLSGREAV